MKKEFLVGVVFLVGIGLAAFGTVAVSGFRLFKPSQTWSVTMDNVGGLQQGDDVRILGLRMGVVHKIQFDRDTNLFTVKLRMDKEAPVHQGYQIVVREASALGGIYLAVEPGPPNAPLADTENLRGSAPVAGGIAGSINDVAAEIKKTFSSINEGKGTVGSLIVKDDVYKDLKQTTESLREITNRINSGEGTLGRLVNDEALYNNLRDLTDRLNNGKGALARLLRDDSGSLVDNLIATSANLNSITGKVDQGKGSLGRLINDPALYDNASTVFADIHESKGILGWLMNDPQAREDASRTLKNVAAITTIMEEGHGTLGQLLTKDDIYNNLLSTSQHLDSSIAKIDNGTGTIGKLVNDPALYEKVKQLVARATDAIENARDSAPVSAITSFLMGPFQ